MCNHVEPRNEQAKFEAVIMHAAQYPKSASPWKHRSRPALEPVMNFVVIVKLLDDQNRLSK